MFDAREALIRGSVYDRQMPTAPMDPAAFHDTYFHTHDRLSYIGAERTIPPAAAARIPVPVGMFIPPVPPPHHSYFGQVGYIKAKILAFASLMHPHINSSEASIKMVTHLGFIHTLLSWNHLVQHNKQYHMKVLLRSSYLIPRL